jgi:hypothetical protein
VERSIGVARSSWSDKLRERIEISDEMRERLEAGSIINPENTLISRAIVLYIVRAWSRLTGRRGEGEDIG